MNKTARPVESANGTFHITDVYPSVDGGRFAEAGEVVVDTDEEPGKIDPSKIPNLRCPPSARKAC